MFEIKCPYCGETVIIEKLKCRIFRHGYRKTTMRQIGPHMLEKSVDRLLEKNSLYGCGRQFKIELDMSITKTTGL